LIRLLDLADDTPMFDLRLRAACRGAGLGTHAVRWLTASLFTELPGIRRIEGTTRQDNAAMRRVFRKCGYVKEAHYRQAWPGLLRAA
jgi:RimJ/RimL family protein N-acetyltransferase